MISLNSVVDDHTAILYLIDRGATSSDIGPTSRIDEETKEVVPDLKLISKLVKNRNKRLGPNFLDAQNLARLLSLAQNNKFDKSIFQDLQPNAQYGPLSYEQKTYIRDNLTHITAQEIAIYVRTNPQNVRLSQHGQFNEPALPKLLNNTRPQGPLTYSEKELICNTRQGDSPSGMAREYNTSVNNIRNALAGKYSPPLSMTTPVHSRPYGPLSLEEKRDIRDNRHNEPTASLGREYNTSDSNVRLAQQGTFKDPEKRGPSHSQQLTALTSLMGQGKTIDGEDLDTVFTQLLKGAKYGH